MPPWYYSPVAPTPNPGDVVAMPVTVQVAVQPGPDGTPMVGLHIQQGTVLFVAVMPPDAADMLGGSIGKGLTDAADQCRVVNGKKIVTAPANALDALNNRRNNNRGN